MGMLPPVVIELKANAAEFQAKMGEVKAQVEETTTTGASHFDKLKNAIGPATMALGATATAVGALGLKLGEPIEQSRKQLEAAITATGRSFEEYQHQVEATDSRMRNFGRGQADTEAAIGKLTVAFQDPAKAMSQMSLAADIAAAKHMSLASAADLLVKASAGSAKSFRQFGITLEENADGTKNIQKGLDEMAARLQGQAAASVDTFGGRLEIMKTKVEDMAGSLGAKLGPALTMAGPLLMGLGTIIESSVVPSILSATVAAAPWIIAIAAVGIAAYELYEHWDTVWGFIKDITSTAVDFLKGVFDKVYNGLGPISTALHLLVDEWKIGWDIIKTEIKIAWDLIKTEFEVGKDIVMTVWKVLCDLLTGHWSKAWNDLTHGIGKIFGDLGAGIRSAFGDLLDGLKNIGPDLMNWGRDLGKAIVDGIVAFIKGAGHLVGDAVKGILSSVPGGSTIAGALHDAHIPFFASGGIVTQPTLGVIGEAGPEAVIPLNRLGGLAGGGVSVHVEVHGNVVGAGGIAELADTLRTSLLQKQNRTPLGFAS